jgi:hypothetical protein
VVGHLFPESQQQQFISQLWKAMKWDVLESEATFSFLPQN